MLHTFKASAIAGSYHWRYNIVAVTARSVSLSCLVRRTVSLVRGFK